MSADPAAGWPARPPGTALRIVASNDLLGTVTSLRTSYGRTGSIAGVQARYQEQLRLGPTCWLDSGDLVAGASSLLLGPAVWQLLVGVPIAAAAAGNHEFDGGLASLHDAAATVGFPILCADRAAGLPASTLLPTPAGGLGVLGVSHPASERLSSAPAAERDWCQRVRDEARALRQQGARWVVAIHHDGVCWWDDPTGDPTGELAGGSTVGAIGTRPDALDRSTAGWVPAVDLVLGGHTLGAWRGELSGVPAGHGYPFATRVLIADLPADPDEPIVLSFGSGSHPAGGDRAGRAGSPAVAGNPATQSPAFAALLSAEASTIGHLADRWTSRRRDADGRYLPRLIAEAVLHASPAEAEAALVLPSQLFTQAPLDGAVAALGGGPVTELDLCRLLPFLDDEFLLVALRPGEFDTIVQAHDRLSDPANAGSDGDWWNWARAPAGTAARTSRPASLLLPGYFVGLAAGWLGRPLVAEPVGAHARQAVRQWCKRWPAPGGLR